MLMMTTIISFFTLTQRKRGGKAGEGVFEGLRWVESVKDGERAEWRMSKTITTPGWFPS